MMDIFTPNKRSEIMSRIRSRNTQPEIQVRKFLHRMGFRFRLHVKSLPGCPDIVMPRHRKIIFVHGCFWHGHKKCKRANRPTSRIDFWNQKIEGNIRRDQRNRKILKAEGWEILVLWQCQINNKNKLMERLGKFLKQTAWNKL